MCLAAGDDGIAMHGEYLLVATMDPSKQAIVVAGHSFPFGKNDTLVFYGHDTQYKGTADIADLYPVAQPGSTAGRRTTSMGNPQGFQSYDDLDFLEVGALRRVHAFYLSIPAPCVSFLAGLQTSRFGPAHVLNTRTPCAPAARAAHYHARSLAGRGSACELAVYMLYCSCP